jgi:hypothetical protein
MEASGCKRVALVTRLPEFGQVRKLSRRPKVYQNDLLHVEVVFLIFQLGARSVLTTRIIAWVKPQAAGVASGGVVLQCQVSYESSSSQPQPAVNSTDHCGVPQSSRPDCMLRNHSCVYMYTCAAKHPPLLSCCSWLYMCTVGAWLQLCLTLGAASKFRQTCAWARWCSCTPSNVALT